ncbi:unnamed protein product [Spodoptera exigua]|nr:unnamed protein product [Spodoptera exigua]
MFVHGIKPGSSEEEEEEDVMDILMKRREECERKARRGEMDPRLEFTFQLLIDGTGLPRHAIMDHVFEGNMLDDINQLFLPHMRNKLLWYYQDVEEIEHRPIPEGTKKGQGKPPPPIITLKKKLFLSDGWDVRFTGVCIYMFRINVSKQLPEEGFHKDLFCGILNAQQVGLVTAIERVMEHVYMNALAHPSSDGEEDETRFPIVKNQLLPGLRSFCSALKVCEDVCNQVNLFDDGQAHMAELQDHTQLKDMAKNPTTITMLEDRVNEWIKKVMEILSESEQLRREVDSSGPQDELEYWKKRGAQFSQLVSYLQDNEVQLTLSCLQIANSKVIKLWRDTDHKITFCYNEAKDNAKFIQAMEKCCHSLYLDDPVKIRESILSLLQTVRLIHSVSQFYNTSERISSLMVKVSQKIMITKLSEKYDRVLRYCEKEVDKITKMFKRQREDPPLPRNYSPVAGRIKWSRCLMHNMTETVESVCAHPVLRALPASADMMRKYSNTRSLIHNYEETMKAVWMNQNLWDVDDCLNNTLLRIDDSGCVVVNLDHTIRLLIRESDCLVKMGVDLPIVCHSLYAKKNYFTLVNDSLQHGVLESKSYT